jgi:plastocyanin
MPHAGWTVLVALASGLAVSAALAANVVSVVQKGRAFASQQLEIKVGDSIRFLNEDSFIHHVFVRSATMNYDSEEQGPGKSVDVRFPTAGTFDVRCEIHPKMLVQVSVR